MEALPQRLIASFRIADCRLRFSDFNPQSAIRNWCGAVVLTASLVGCTPLGKLPSMVDETPKPSAHCCQAVATWSNKVHYVPDTVNNGTPAPGIVGRFYLFGERIDYPQVGDGALIVDLFNDAAPAPNGQPLERWHIDADKLHLLLRKDTIGWGYTLFLPWGSCRPDITRVHMTARYEPRSGGTPLYAPSSGLTLEHPPSPAAAASQRPEAGGARGIPPIGPPAAPVPPVAPSRPATP